MLGLIYWEFLPQGNVQTIDRFVYMNMLNRLENVLQQNRPGKRVIYLHDNARPHTSNEVQGNQIKK